jgi:hypothetical protein
MKFITRLDESHAARAIERIRNRQHPAWSALHGEVRVEPLVLTNVGRVG